jgi:hypothetical protein
VNIRVQGFMAEPAHTAVAADGTAWLMVRVCMGAHSPQARAGLRMGTGHAAQHACAAAAHRLPKGARVAVHAAGWRLARDPTHLDLTDVSLIEPLDALTHLAAVAA